MEIVDRQGTRRRFDHVVIATHADQALAMLSDTTANERELLGTFAYSRNEAVLHSDPRLMPRRKRAWSAWNYLAETQDDARKLSVTYWMNRLQSLPNQQPLFVTLNMIPKVALGPLFIVWFSYGIFPNILIAFSICFFPILLTTARGLSEVEPDLLDLVKSLRGSRWILFRKIQLPGALPYVFSGMKVGAILAVAGAIVGEFIASERGLGYLMIQVQSSLDTPAMVMAVLLLTLLGIALYGLVLGLERLFVVRDIRLQ